MQVVNKHMVRCLTSLVIIEMEIKNTVRYTLYPLGCLYSKKTVTISVKYVEKMENTDTPGGKVKWYNPLENILAVSQKVNTELSFFFFSL